MMIIHILVTIKGALQVQREILRGSIFTDRQLTHMRLYHYVGFNFHGLLKTVKTAKIRLLRNILVYSFCIIHSGS